MHPFYSILKIAPNTASDDSLSIGLLLFNGEQYLLQFSTERKNACKHLMNSNAEALDFVTKQISNSIKKLNGLISKQEIELFTHDGLLNVEYFSYLNKYFSGLIRFTKPSLINDEKITLEKFNQLFSLLVDNSNLKIKKALDKTNEQFKNSIDINLIKKVEHKIHTKINIDSKVIPAMHFNFEMDCIGKNGVFIGAKSLAFDKSVQTLDKDISHYISFISLISNQQNPTDSRKNNFYLIADEPNSSASEEHKTWESIQKNPMFEIVHSEAVNIIAEKVEQSNAKTFIIT